MFENVDSSNTGEWTSYCLATWRFAVLTLHFTFDTIIRCLWRSVQRIRTASLFSPCPVNLIWFQLRSLIFGVGSGDPQDEATLLETYTCRFPCGTAGSQLHAVTITYEKSGLSLLLDGPDKQTVLRTRSKSQIKKATITMVWFQYFLFGGDLYPAATAYCSHANLSKLPYFMYCDMTNIVQTPLPDSRYLTMV